MELIDVFPFFWNEFFPAPVLLSQEGAVRLKISRIWLVCGLALVVLAAGVPARAAKDVVHFGSSIDVGAGESIHDAVCFFCSVNVRGNVKGDLVVFFGDVRIDGRADHDVVNFFGGVELGRNVTVGQDAVVMFGQMREASSSSVGGSKVVESGLLFWIPFLLIAGMVSFGVRELRWIRRRRFLRGY